MSKQQGPNALNGIVTGGGDKKTAALTAAMKRFVPKTRKQILFTVGVLVVLAGAVTAAWYFTHKQDDAVKTTLSADAIAKIPTEDYEGMTEKELDYRVQVVTGHTVQEIQTMDINGRTLKNYEAAYAASQTLQRYGKTDKAFQAYALADTKAPKDAYRFHLRYAYFAYQNDKNSIAIAQAKKAKTSAALANLTDAQRKHTNDEANTFLVGQGGTQ